MYVYCNKVQILLSLGMRQKFINEIAIKNKVVPARVTDKMILAERDNRIYMLFKRLSKYAGAYPVVWSLGSAYVGKSRCVPELEDGETLFSTLMKKGSAIFVRYTELDEQHVTVQDIRKVVSAPQKRRYKLIATQQLMLESIPRLFLSGKFELVRQVCLCLESKGTRHPMDMFKFHIREDGWLWGYNMFGEEMKLSVHKGPPGPITWLNTFRHVTLTRSIMGYFK